MQRVEKLGKITKLIDMVRAHPAIYDRNDDRYRRADQKDSAWHRIATELDLDETDARKAWRSLRDQFGKALRESLSGHPARRRRAKYFDRLSFLKDIVMPNDSTFEYEYTQDGTIFGDNLRDDEDDPENLHEDDTIDEKIPEYRKDPFNDLQDSHMEFICSSPVAKRRRRTQDHSVATLTPVATAPTPPMPDFDTNETFEQFLKTVLTHLTTTSVASPPKPDSLDNFFLCVSTLVKEADVKGMELMQLKCNVMNYVVNEICKLKKR